MLKKIYAAILVAITAGNFAMAQSGTLKGKAIDETNGEGLSFANVQLEQGGNAVAKTVADMDGNYTIKPIPPGTYDLKVASVGYQTFFVKGIIISGDKTTYQEAKVKSTAIEKDAIVIVDYVVPLIDPDTKTGGTVTKAQFDAMPSKDVNSVAATTAGVFQKDEGSSLNIRGGRSQEGLGAGYGPGNADQSSTKFYIDGVPARNTTGLPQGDIEQISVITGGLPAQYGDATGGVVNITTRGGVRPEFYGGVELISSQLTDAFGKNNAQFNVGGPLLSKKDSSGHNNPKIGFFISGEVNSEKDPTPTTAGVYKVKDDKLKEIEDHPLRMNDVGTGIVLSSQYITMDDMEHIKARQNSKSNTARLGGKLDFKVTEKITFTLGGSMDYGNYHSFIYDYSMFNPSNNPQIIYNDMRVYGKISHKLGRQHSKDEKTSSLIQDAYYSLQVSYDKYKETEQDDTHKDNFFNYGYVGKFETFRSPGYTAVLDSATGAIKYYDQNPSWSNDSVLFTAGDVNPLAANYTNDYYDLVGTPKTLTDIQPLGMLNGNRPQSPYSLWNNTGRQYNGYHNLERSQLRFSGTFSADIKNHAIKAGFDYEKRVDRNWSIVPVGLWTQARLLVNKHLTQLDTSAANTTITTINGVDYHNHPYFVNSSAQSQFDKSLRDNLGISDAGQWIDLDNLEPSQLAVNMFSPDELLNNGSSYVGYYGYSYDNKKLTGTKFDMTALESFYKDKDAGGNYYRTIPAFQPVYIAGYIQDNFDIKDMKFNIGLRVDAYNANQPTLKDKYLLYEAYTVGEDNKFTHPTNMGSDYVIYVDDINSPGKVVGYRKGDTWYDAQGIMVSDPKVIAQATSSGSIQPFLKYPHENFLDSSKVSNVFEMYQTQVNLMPRIAFNFPISDRADFFAHYDVLTQRPPSNSRFDATDYLFIQSGYFSTISNPALKPERTTDYEVGFRQVLSERKNAALTISAFYRQMRDMLQQMNVFDAYPVSYITYGNLDFGNVKGFTVAYDLRKTQNSQLTASYTLQFAEGTGSASNTASSVIAAGQPNLRSTNPLDFDQRHAIVINYDYHFSGGKEYNGPSASWAKMVFENFGGNIVLRAGSGLPYTRLKNVVSGNGNNGTQVILGLNQPSTLQGDINGSNLPWQYRIDLRLDKNIPIKMGKGTEDKVKLSNLTVYLQVLNLLNTQNILNVYRHTGDPKDDGYLSDPGNQGSINSQVSPTAFVDMYNAKLANPGNFSIPRRVRIGVVLNF